MTRIEESAVVGAPLDKVYALAVDWRNLTGYFDYVKEVRPAAEKTVGEGARLSLRAKFSGRTMDSPWEGTEHTESAGWAFDATLMGMSDLPVR